MTAHFTYHAYYGRHGLLARQRLLERASLLEFENRSLEAVCARLRRDVALLGSEFADPDMVEDLARETLGFVHPGDRIVTIKP